jgi:hypothetical protein
MLRRVLGCGLSMLDELERVTTQRSEETRAYFANIRLNLERELGSMWAGFESFVGDELLLDAVELLREDYPPRPSASPRLRSSPARERTRPASEPSA